MAKFEESILSLTLLDQIETANRARAVQAFYRLRLATMQVPEWRDDPAYFWATAAKRKREARL